MHISTKTPFVDITPKTSRERAGHFPTSTKAWLSAAATELPLLPMGERFRRQLNLSAQQFIQRPERSLWG
jgi:hypothetical protein